jgi:hypothetical protein
MGCNNIMQIEKTIKIDISDKDIEIVRLIAEGETISHTIRGKKNDNLIQGNSVSIQVNGFTAVASEMTFSPVQTNS